MNRWLAILSAVVGAMLLLSAWAGIVVILLGPLRTAPEVSFTVLMGGIIAMTVFTFACSYHVWTADPAERRARRS